MGISTEREEPIKVRLIGSKKTCNPYRPPVSPPVESQPTSRSGRPLLFYLLISFPVAWWTAGVLSFQVIVPLASLFIDSRKAQVAILFVTLGLLTLSLTGLNAVVTKRLFENPATPMHRKIAWVVSEVLSTILLVVWVGAIVYQYD